MRRKASGNAEPLPWKRRVLAALTEFDCATARSQRMAALGKLQTLFAGKGARKEALRKCLALTRRVERLRIVRRTPPR